MAKNRKAAEEYIYWLIGEIENGGDNVERYKRFFATLNNQQFEDFINGIADGTKILSITAPVGGKAKLSVENALRVAKLMKHNFFQRIWMPASGSIPSYLTPVPYLVFDPPLRRASQTLTKKLSVADQNKSFDALSGQTTSQGASLTFPELQLLTAMGMDSTVTELIKYRGGDMKGLRAMQTSISRFGTAQQKVLANYSSGVVSTTTLKTFLTSMMLKSTL